jgi:hypothetical protein
VQSAGLAICAATTAVQAQTLIEEWGTAKFPAPPPLKTAKLDAKETAILEAVSKPRNGHFRWFSGDDQTRKTGHCVIAEGPSKRLVNTPAMSFETDS